MTDAEIDKLDGLALRKAVADAVGWEIRCPGHRDEWICDTHAHTERFDSNRRLMWNDVFAACQAAGAITGEYYVAIGGDSHSICCGEWGPVASSRGKSPEVLCRALLKFVEFRKRQPTPIEHKSDPDEHPGYEWQPSDPVWPKKE